MDESAVLHPEGAQQRFKSQLAYAGGALMCTSASVHWLLACLYKDKSDFFPEALLDTVMRWAAAQHEALTGRGLSSQRMLQHEEVISGIGVPASFPHRVYCGHHLEHGPEEMAGFGDVVHMRVVEALLAPGTGCAVTANQHTVAAYRDRVGGLWLFDSLPGVERRVAAGGLAGALDEHLRRFEVCTLTRLEHHPGKRAKPCG